MTVASITIRADYTGSGITGPYTFPFTVFNIADLKIIQTDLNGVDTNLLLNTNFTAVGVKGPTDFTQGGTITLNVALTSGFHLAIVSNESGIQSTSIKNNSAYYAYLHENAFDYRSLTDLQLLEKTAKSILAPDSEPSGTANLILPHVSQRALKQLGFDAFGNLAMLSETPTGSVNFTGTGIILATIANMVALLQLFGLYIGPAAVANGVALAAIASPQGGWIAYQTDIAQAYIYNAQSSTWEKVQTLL